MVRNHQEVAPLHQSSDLHRLRHARLSGIAEVKTLHGQGGEPRHTPGYVESRSRLLSELHRGLVLLQERQGYVRVAACVIGKRLQLLGSQLLRQILLTVSSREALDRFVHPEALRHRTQRMNCLLWHRQAGQLQRVHPHRRLKAKHLRHNIRVKAGVVAHQRHGLVARFQLADERLNVLLGGQVAGLPTSGSNRHTVDREARVLDIGILVHRPE